MKLKRLVSLALAPILLAQFVLGFQASAHADTTTIINSVPMIDPNTGSVVSAGLVGDKFTFTTANPLGGTPSVTFTGAVSAPATLVPGTTSTYSLTLPNGAQSGPYSITGGITGTSDFQLWQSRGEPYKMPDGHLNVTYQDLKFILDNIKMAEAHSIRTRAGGATGIASNTLKVEIPTTTLIYPYDMTSTTRCLTADDVANAAKNSGSYALGSTSLSAPYVWTQEDPYGVRQVDGQCNNISNVQAETPQTSIYSASQAANTPGNIPVVPLAAPTDTAGWGAADELFGRDLPSATQPNAPYSLTPTQLAYQNPTSRVIDATPRDISNLISDQTTKNPAAVAAAYEAMDVLYGGTSYASENSINATTGSVSTVLDIPNITADYNVSAGYDSSFTIFGQFFDHGLDLIPKAGPSVLIPLRADDPLYMPGQNNFMVLTRGQDSNGDSINETTPWIDQSQSYGSHPSQNFFLREYSISSSNGIANISSTGRLLEGQDVGHKTAVNDVTTSNKGVPTWYDIKAQSARLGFNITDYDALSVPVVATDQYGKFIPGPHGYPMMLFTDSNTRQYVWVEGNGTTPISTGYAGKAAFPTVASYSYPAGTNWKAVPSGHNFINDTTASAVPYAAGYCPNPGALLTPDADQVVNSAAWSPNCSTYDNETLDLHYVAGDGRVNENIALSAFHGVFHSEHNLVAKDIIDELNNNPVIPVAFRNEFLNKPDRIYQAARFVMELEYQHMAYDEFVRRISPNLPVFITYDPTKNAAVSQEFASAVYRLGHSMLNETIPRAMPGQAYDPQNNEDVSLLDAFTNPSQARMRRPAYIDSASYNSGTHTITYQNSNNEIAPNNGDVVTISYMDNSDYNVIDGVVSNSTGTTFDISKKYVNGSLVNLTAPLIANSSLIPPTTDPTTSSSLVADGSNYAKVVISNSANGPDYSPMESAAMLIQGLTSQRGNEIDEFTTDAVRNNLLGLPLDLPSLNLTRGRDVGVPTLNQYRAMNSAILPPYVSWVDFINKLRHPLSGANFVAAYGTHPLLTNEVGIARVTSTTPNPTGTGYIYTFIPVYDSVYHVAQLPKKGDVVNITQLPGAGNVTGGIIASVTTAPFTFTITSTIGNNLALPRAYTSSGAMYADLTPTPFIASAGGVYTGSIVNVTRQPNLSERRQVGTVITNSTIPQAVTGAGPDLTVTGAKTGLMTYSAANNFSPGQIVSVDGFKGGATCFKRTGVVVKSDATQFTLGATSVFSKTLATNQGAIGSVGIYKARVTSVGTVTFYTNATSVPTDMASGQEISISGLPIAGLNLQDVKVSTSSSSKSGSSTSYFFTVAGIDTTAIPSGDITSGTISAPTGLAVSFVPNQLVSSSFTCTYESPAISAGYALATGFDYEAGFSGPSIPSDAYAFMYSSKYANPSGTLATRDWSNTSSTNMGPVGSSATGIDNIDLWMGGLAENPAKQPILPGMLGTTFQQVYSDQVQRLQDADRFYYLGRVMGYNLVDGLQGQKFATMAARNTPTAGSVNPTGITNLGLMGLTNPSFSVSDCAISNSSALVPPSQSCSSSTIFTNPNTGNISHVGLDNMTMFADPNPVSGTTIVASVDFTGGAGDDSMNGGAGNDTLDGGIGGDLIHGGPGNDLILGGAGEDIIQGNEGNDVINAGDSQIGDVSDGGSGSDWTTCGNCHAVIPLFTGGPGNDFVQGGANADLLLNGGEGDDWIEGLGGWDIMNGDEGISQQIYNVTTQIYGGNDVLEGNGGVNTESGDGGDDIFLVGQGVDQIFGMAGFDWADYEYANRYDNGPAVRPNIWIDLSGASISPNTSRQGDMLGTTEAISGSSGNDQIYGGIGTADATYTANVVAGSNIITVTTAQTINPGQQVSGTGIAPNATVVLSTIKGTKTEVTLSVASTATSVTSVIFTTWPLQAPSLITNLTSVVSGTEGWNKYTALDPLATKWSGGAVLLGGDGNDSVYPSSGSDVIHGSAYLHTCIGVDTTVSASVYAAVADVPCGNGTSATTLRGFSNMSLATPLLENRSISPDQLHIVRELLPTSSAVTGITADGSKITYSAKNNYYVGELITISGLTKVGTDLTPYNLTNLAVTAATATTFTVASRAPSLAFLDGLTGGTSVPTDTLDLSGGSTVFVAGTLPGVGGGISGPSSQFTFAKLAGPLPVGASFGCTVTDSSSGNVITVYDVEMVKFTTGNAVPIPNCGGVGVPDAPAAPIVDLDTTHQNLVLRVPVAPAANGSPIDYYNFQYAPVTTTPARGGGRGGRGATGTPITAGTCSGNVLPSVVNSSTQLIGCTVLNLTPATAYTFTVSAHNSLGSSPYSANSANATFPTITIPVITLSSAAQTVNAGQAIVPVTVGNSGGTIATFTVSTNLGGSTLPAGISFNSTNGTISGTPTSVTAPPVVFTVSATNVIGTSTATFTLTVNAVGSAPTITYSPNSQSVVAGDPMASTTPSSTAGPVNTDGFTVTTNIGALPSWVTFAAATGTISGTPPAGTTPGSIIFTVTATGQFGTGTATFTLNVTGVPVIAYSPATASVNHGSALPSATSNSAIKPVNTGGAATSFACTTPAGGACPLPAGVSFSTATGAFTGTPTQTSPSTTQFSVTATNSAGTSAATRFDLNITDPVAAAPVAPGTPAGGAPQTGGAPQAVLTFTNNATAPLPAGTSITLAATSTATGQISYAVSGANCQLTRNILVATASGATCVVTATQAVTGGTPVTQSATFIFGLQAQAALRINNRVRTTNHGLGITLSTAGGSGSGAVTYQVVPGGTGTACRITTDGTGVTSPDAGTTCNVTATKAASGVFDAVTSSVAIFTFQ